MSRSDNLILREVAIALLCAIFLSSCATGGTFGMPNATPMNWAFIQSVGGIRLGDPYFKDSMRWVPIFVDVSGAQTITVTPTLRNTGLVCSAAPFSGGGSKAITGGMDFWLTVYTEPESTTTNIAGMSSSCPDIPLNFRPSFGGSTTVRFYYIQKTAIAHILNSKENLIGVIN